MDKQLYTVTAKAGPHVAGIAVVVDQRISLTEDEARFELLAGTIVPYRETPVEEDTPPAPEDPPAPAALEDPPAPGTAGTAGDDLHPAAGQASAGHAGGAAGAGGGGDGGAAPAPSVVKSRRKSR